MTAVTAATVLLRLLLPLMQLLLLPPLLLLPLLPMLRLPLPLLLPLLPLMLLLLPLLPLMLLLLPLLLLPLLLPLLPLLLPLLLPRQCCCYCHFNISHWGPVDSTKNHERRECINIRS